jgi:hypothetical protein
LGIEDDGALPDNEVLNQHSPKEPVRLTWLAGGMLIMSILIAVAVFAAVSSSSETVPSAEVAVRVAETASKLPNRDDAISYASAERFLAEIDAGKWAKSWNTAGDFVQSQVSLSQWEEALSSAREPLGAVVNRELVSVEQANELPGLPTGDYEVLIFSTRFDDTEVQKFERLVMARQKEGFMVIGYFIQ